MGHQWNADHPAARRAYLRIADQQAYLEMRRTLLEGPGTLSERARLAVIQLTEHVHRTLAVRSLDEPDPDPAVVTGTYTAVYDRLVVGGIDTGEPPEPAVDGTGEPTAAEVAAP